MTGVSLARRARRRRGSAETFPRLGGMLIGSPQNYSNTTYRQQIAKLDLAILGMFNGWNGGTAATSVNAIKALNPGILLGNYTEMTQTQSTPDAATTTRWNKINSEVGPSGIGNWWAYDSAGAHTDWSGGSFASWDINITAFVTADGNGDRYPQYAAKLDYTQVISGVAWDFWYCDNNFWRPRDDPDWNRNGANDDNDNLTVRGWWRDAQRVYYDQAKALAPNIKFIVNADSDLDGSRWPEGADTFTQYKNQAHAALMEHAIGKDWSVETWSGWINTMAWYRSLKANLLSPKMVMFDMFLASTTDYQTFRYGFASCLMDDGYFSASTDYNEIVWFDEYDLAGTSTTKWLGAAIEPPQTSAWRGGVYRRVFANGMVLVNPKGNGSQTIPIGSGSYHRFSGTQAPSVNDGTTVSSTVTLADRDGLFLVGTGAGGEATISGVGTLAYATGTTSNTTLAVSPTAVGNLLVLSTSLDTSLNTVTGVSGGGVTTWTRVGGPYVSPSHGRTHDIWIGKVTTAGAATITLTTSTSVAGVRVDRGVQEFTSSLGSAATWSADGSAGTNSATSATMQFATLTPSGSPRIFFGYGVTGGSPSSAAGYTLQTDGNGNPWIYSTGVFAAVSPTVTQTSGAYSTLGVLIRAS